jgi:hypothetical protein
VSSALPQHEQRRAELYENLANVGDFRRGTINATYRRCGKPNCACADPDHRGHGPRYLLSRTVNGKTESRQLAPGAELEKANSEVANYKQFQSVVAEIVEVNEAICDLRPVSPPAAGNAEAVTGAEKGGSSRTSRRTSPPR